MMGMTRQGLYDLMRRKRVKEETVKKISQVLNASRETFLLDEKDEPEQPRIIELEKQNIALEKENLFLHELLKEKQQTIEDKQRTISAHEKTISWLEHLVNSTNKSIASSALKKN